jgi:hypothetical protein
MKRRLGNSLFWLITTGCALATCALVMPWHVNAAATYRNFSCESAWGPNLDFCRCDCRATWRSQLSSGTTVYHGAALARVSGTSTGYTDTGGASVTNPNNQAVYNGTQARTRVKCTDSDVNFAQIDSAWGPTNMTYAHESSHAQCPGAAPIAYETFCKVKVFCTASSIQ